MHSKHTVTKPNAINIVIPRRTTGIIVETHAHPMASVRCIITYIFIASGLYPRNMHNTIIITLWSRAFYDKRE